MANWYQRKPSFDAALIMLLRMGKVDVVIASLELAKAICESETDDIPESVAPFIDEIKTLGLMQHAADLLHSLRVKRETRERAGAPVSAQERAGAPRVAREEKRREEKKREEERREEKREILQPGSSDLDHAGGRAREAEPAPKPEPSFDEFQAMGRAVLEAQRKAHGIRSIK